MRRDLPFPIQNGHRTATILLAVAVVLLVLATTGSLVIADEASEFANQVRRPVRLAWNHDQSSLWVANQASGSLSEIQIANHQGTLVAEYPIAESVSTLLPWNDARQLLVAHADSPQISIVDIFDSVGTVTQKLTLQSETDSLCQIPGGFATNVPWQRKVWLYTCESSEDAGLRISDATEISLPFFVRSLLYLPQQNALIASDRFGGHLAIIATAQRRLICVRHFDFHNIGELTWDADGNRLLMTVQALNPALEPSDSNIQWGLFLPSGIRQFQPDVMVDTSQTEMDVLRSGKYTPLSDIRLGAGDPHTLAVTNSGQLVVSLSGVNRVAFLQQRASDQRRAPVGVRPTHMLLSADSSLIATANTLDDSVSLVQIADNSSDQIAAWQRVNDLDASGSNLQLEAFHDVTTFTQTISLGPRPELSHSELGERIFTDATRSHDHWFSCHSCHINGHSNGRLADTQGDGSYGTPKRVPSLFGVADTSPWSWTGHFAALEDQLQKTAQSTMIGRKFSRDELVHLQSFLSGLQAPAAAQPATPEAAEQVVQGKAVFERRQCTACHHGHAFSAHTVFDVGLVDEQGETHFNPPSLIGVRLRQAFFHDASALSLGEVVDQHSPKSDAVLSAADRSALIAYLESL